ncbi:hypothetical protein [Cyanobium sp. WAJ14-Wanaka]|uniref:hypothetical protein n=1 Tax=Cyanobium sp. WAJ14-Wanaka TaxID=2823725 RepID=UPI0020CF3E43|nr:hypothetical protein [Cyanobium sp. WAJ14-Wanaka]MCP9775677.1 hypothetical protein [Cyanobium sp. WAJ14-Wanaka]
MLGIWLYLYVVIDVWSRKGMAWWGAEREIPSITADLVSMFCLRKRISRGRMLPLILYNGNVNALLAATLACWLKELGVLKFFYR